MFAPARGVNDYSNFRDTYSNKMKNKMKNRIYTELGTNDIGVDVEYSENENEANHLTFTFYQKGNTAVVQKVTLNCVKREQIVKLAANLKKLVKKA